jgi:intein/homing endonuclease
MKDGKQLWTYSCHPSTGEFSPGLISWAGVTQKSAKAMKITLDNGESIVCTYDHKFPIYDLGFVEAKDLAVGQSMIPLHKESVICISAIDYLTDEIEVGTLTIDSDESIHNYHTFALSCGVYTKNSNLGELTDLDYFKRNLYKSLNVPETRIGGDSGFNLGRSTEILRDEVKFTKFVGRLRKRFSQLFIDLLRTQLLLKNIVTPEDWKKMAEHIQFDFLYDNHFAELKESELFTERLNMASMAEPYVGRYFSQDYLRRKILRQTDEEIIEQDEIMAKEIEDGIIPDPNAPVDPQTGLPIEVGMVPPEGTPGAPPRPTVASSAGNNINGQSGKVPVEPDVKPKEPKMPKGGEI